MKKKILCFLAIIIYIVSVPMLSFSHSGKTDSNGGHKDNKNKSGLGSYHYHCGGNPPHLHTGGICPYDSNSTPSSSSNKSSNTYSAPSSSSNSNTSSSSPSTPESASTVPAVVYSSRIDATNVPTSITCGESVQLKGSVYPSNAQDNIITWSSDTPSVATVSSSGELTAKNVGTAVISAKTVHGTTATFTITVNEIVATSIEIDNKPESMTIDEMLFLDAILTPSNSTNTDITWSSSDDSVVTVTSSGTITAESIGTAIITATHNNLQDSFELKVLPIEAENIEIHPVDIPENKIKSNSKIQLKATIQPSDTTDKTIKWSVSDENIATINENGELYFKSGGTITVTAETSNGLTSSIEITSTSNSFAVVGGIIVCVAIIIIVIVFFAKRKKRRINDI